MCACGESIRGPESSNKSTGCLCKYPCPSYFFLRSFRVLVDPQGVGLGLAASDGTIQLKLCMGELWWIFPPAGPSLWFFPAKHKHAEPLRDKIILILSTLQTWTNLVSLSRQMELHAVLKARDKVTWRAGITTPEFPFPHSCPQTTQHFCIDSKYHLVKLCKVRGRLDIWNLGRRSISACNHLK